MGRLASRPAVAESSLCGMIARHERDAVGLDEMLANRTAMRNAHRNNHNARGGGGYSPRETEEIEAEVLEPYERAVEQAQRAGI